MTWNEIDEEFLAGASAPDSSKASTRDNPARLRFLSDPPLPPQEWLVPGIFPKRCVSVVAGAPGCGKTALLTNLAVAGCEKTRWLGREVRGGPTLWLAAEAAKSTEDRIRALTGFHPSLPVCFATQFPSLLDERVVSVIINSIDAAAEHFGAKVELLVLDSLSSAMRGGDENGSKDMTRAMGALLELTERRNVTTIVLTHIGKGTGLQTRGHSSVTADATAAFAIRQKQGMNELINVKQRDAELATPIPFRVVKHQDALMVEPTLKQGLKGQETKLSRRARLFLESLVDNDGLAAVGDIKAACQETFGATTYGAFRQAFSSARKELLDRGMISVEGKVVSVRQVSESVRDLPPARPVACQRKLSEKPPL